MTNTTDQKDYKELGSTHGYEEYSEMCRNLDCSDYSMMIATTNCIRSAARGCWVYMGFESELLPVNFVSGYQEGAENAISELKHTPQK